MKKENELVIIQDTREKHPWNFSYSCEIGTLETGDYTIKGLERLVRIERKASIEEIANNLGKEFDRFEREMTRMLEYKYRYVVCEFPISDIINYPNSCKLKMVRDKAYMSGKFLLKRVNELQINYGINFIFCDNKAYAIEYVSSLLKRIHGKHSENIG